MNAIITSNIYSLKYERDLMVAKLKLVIQNIEEQLDYVGMDANEYSSRHNLPKNFEVGIATGRIMALKSILKLIDPDNVNLYLNDD